MITLTFKDITNQGFHNGMNKISDHQGFTPQVAYQIGKICDKIEQEAKKARALYTTMADKYGKKNDKGGFIQCPTDPFFEFKDDVKREDWAKEHEEFMAISFTIDREKISFATVGKVTTLSPKDYLWLEPIVDMTEEVATVHEMKKKT
jgi:hypothetical protein